MIRADLGYRYEVWRFLHGIGAILVSGFGVLHATRAGRYSEASPLWLFWWALFALAVLSLVYVYVLKPLAQFRRPWRVASVERTAERIWQVTLTPEGHDGLSYAAGQFAWVNFGHAPFSLSENPFSISSGPSTGRDVSFLIKELGDSTSRLAMLQPGTRTFLDAPFGNLTVRGHDAPGIALIAGGVGVAPMLGILREKEATGDTRPAMLIYANRHPGQIACRDDLDRFESRGTEVIHVLSEPPPGWQGETGFVDADLIARYFDNPQRKDWLYVLCGPPPMLDAVEDALIAIGIPADRILFERFVYD